MSLTRWSQITIAAWALAACGGEPRGSDASGTDSSRVLAVSTTAADSAGTTASVRTTVSAGQVATRRDTGDYPVVRALYMNRFAAQSWRKMNRMFALADTTEINGFVIDIKDEFGLNYKSDKPELARNAGNTHGRIPNLKALLDSMKAHNLYSIARIVVFKDSAAAANNPAWTIKTPDGSQWKDEKGNAWVNPYDRNVWEYNLGVAEEMARAGFDEIQFDYIRFPEPYRRLAPQVFPGAGPLKKHDLLTEFLKAAQARLHPLNVLVTADIFGLVTTVKGPLEVGQWWEKISPYVDVVLPMVYPSHYPRGAYGIARPNAEPYAVLKFALDGARKRDVALGITRAEHVRPWVQAFSIGQPEYTAEHVAAQIKAIYGVGYNGWILWSPGSRYDAFVPAFAKTDP
ncbi:MAG TPA: putative glycoside hydrolase [Gemmatimonadaceae bacterium]|nr:putative glycoside hydrolase [Gemmatimonadaceae bacterium]